MTERLVATSVVTCSVAASTWAVLHGYLYGLTAPGLVVLPVLYPVLLLPILLARMVLPRQTWPAAALVLMHLLGVTLLPALLSVELGGFSSSGGVIFWSSAGPLSSLLLHLRPTFKYAFLGLFIGAVVFAFAWANTTRQGLFDEELVVVEEWQVQLYAFMTVLGMASLTYVMLYVLQRDVSAQAALHRRLVDSFLPSPVATECLRIMLEQSRSSVPKMSRSNRVRSDSNGALPTTRLFQRPATPQSAVSNESSNRGTGLTSFAVTVFNELDTGIARTHASVTVVRCDILGVLSAHHHLPAPALLAFTKRLVTALDAYAEAFGITRVCFNHDGSYVAVAGLMAEFRVPSDRSNHAARAALFALAVQAAARFWSWPDGKPVQLKFGLASGSLSSGLAGNVQKQYFLAGEMPALAARLAYACQPKCVQLTTECASMVRSSLASGPVANALARCGAPLLHMETTATVRLPTPGDGQGEELVTTLLRLEDNDAVLNALPAVCESLEQSRRLPIASWKRGGDEEDALPKKDQESGRVWAESLQWLIES